MLDQNFCSFLEYHLSKCFKHATDEDLKHFWCDGITLPSNESSYSIKSINDNRLVVLTAYLGKNGQEEYSLLIKFGDRSLSRYSRELNINNCIPDFEKNDWYFVDKKKKHITIQLH